ncbi:ATP-binding cassette domain-containing protein [Moraxella sp. FZLJ2107]|uniref:ABC-F family ATP-binding cassette domain-containing protein n=1 Tax=unclassified Moraxella TaxID=2685852 RepID=UPI0020C8D34A|nr:MULTISPECIES: ATP-binding cassette domain-containing protein [unclassified Moraxella]UTO04480.1 ATP-binding cassette domain-containing protein [Moraxella sp. FZLJ2107]UTO23313.1 ATP-binding cassette domain-containing protein [Moraxella sp. FZLJ2109]
MIEFKDVAVRREGRLLFSDVNLQLHKGQKIGLTGNNGTGKSTLFATILGEYATDLGQVSMPSSWQIAHMAQEIHATDMLAIDYVLSGDAEWWQLNDKISRQDTLSADEIAPIYQRFEEIDGYRTRAKAAMILSGLGFGEAEHTKAVAMFSGGWRMRLNLARTLMHRADVLLLDEPTNHLDLDVILWLEEWLQKFDELVLLISHDQAFLDAICGHILHIEQGKITLYTGNYSQFVRTRAERLAHEQQAYEKQQAVRAHLEDYIRRFRVKATKAKQAQSRIKQLDRMTELSPVMADSAFSFKFYEPSHMASPLISLDNATIGYDGVPMISKVNLQITPSVRMGILGANGAGKSTLIKALVGELPLISGVHKVSETLKLGYFNQHQMDSLDDDATPMVMLRRIAGQTSDADLRAFLGSFDFRGERIDTVSRLFSGGERARLMLALLVWQRPNVLVLDEPTNHLDLQMRNALMLALQDFAGALILVSHDRDLILSVCDELWLVADGRCTEFVGDMSDYAEHLKKARQERQLAHKEQKEVAKPECVTPQAQTPANDGLSKEERRKKNAQIREQTAPLRKQIAKLESELEMLGSRLDVIENDLSDSGLYDDANKAKLLEKLNEQSKLKDEIETAEEALLMAKDELETLESELA